ncbi:hypothetical protein RD792_000203 [Penstemon davidsonii]|uniref:Cytochrome P450 n=1 Tax=Penstemon davidsonii TaxID=160366 RepID=A0ABR0DVF9_9LAMI|nr:hypothetical protein RD792_000203 [Penstemon davidsonii]
MSQTRPGSQIFGFEPILIGSSHRASSRPDSIDSPSYGPQALPVAPKPICVRKCAYPSLIVHSFKRPRYSIVTPPAHSVWVPLDNCCQPHTQFGCPTISPSAIAPAGNRTRDLGSDTTCRTSGVTHLVYKWRSPKCNGVLPPGSMGLPFIGETLQYFSPQPFEGIPPFISQRIARHLQWAGLGGGVTAGAAQGRAPGSAEPCLEPGGRFRYGPLFRTSILGLRVVVSSDPVVNHYIFQQEGNAFQSWYTESSIKILGEKNVNGHHGNAHKYLRNLFMDLLGPKNLKGELIHETDRNTRDHLSSWACKDEVEVKEELEIMVFKLAAKKLLDFDEKQVLELRGNYKFIKKAFISLPLSIPGTALHAALQGRKKAKKMIKCAFDARRLSKENNLDFIGRLLKEIEDEGTILTEEITSDIVYILLFAAFETTSTTITLCLKFIHEHPKVLEQLKVINETVRLADNAPGIFRKVMQDVNIKGKLKIFYIQ